jgi:hypothetical protein
VQDPTKIKGDKTIQLWDGVSNNNGQFDLRCSAGRRPYYLLYFRLNGIDYNVDVHSGHADPKSKAYFYVPDGGNLSLGTIKVIK